MSASNDTTDFEKAVARACLRRVARNDFMDLLVHGDAVAVRYGAFTAEIATEARISVHKARRLLLSLCTEGKVLRDDRAGGRTTWWPVGLAAAQSATAVPPAAAPARQAFAAPAPHERQHWSDVLGVARDCSTSEARAAFQSAVAALDQADPDYPNQSRRVRDAIDACCRDHEIQIDN